MRPIEGLTGEERKKVQDEVAEYIENHYPYKPGRDPETLARADEVLRELQDKGITWQNFLEGLDDRTDEEISVMLTNVRNMNCWGWISEDRKERPEVTDRERAEEIRDGVVRFSWLGWKEEYVPSRFWKEVCDFEKELMSDLDE